MSARREACLCRVCGARFAEPITATYREDMNGEGAYQSFYIDLCPDCGSEEVEEFEILQGGT